MAYVADPVALEILLEEAGVLRAVGVVVAGEALAFPEGRHLVGFAPVIGRGLPLRSHGQPVVAAEAKIGHRLLEQSGVGSGVGAVAVEALPAPEGRHLI